MKREGALAPKILTFEDMKCDMKADATLRVKLWCETHESRGSVDGIAPHVVHNVETQTIRLVVVQTQPSTDHLLEQDRALGGASHYDAINTWNVSAFCKNAAIDEDRKFLGSEGFQELLAHLRGRVACDSMGLNACASKLRHEVFGVLDIDAKDKRRLARWPGKLEPSFNDHGVALGCVDL